MCVCVCVWVHEHVRLPYLVDHPDGVGKPVLVLHQRVALLRCHAGHTEERQEGENPTVSVCVCVYDRITQIGSKIR
jgi:hypothetical protein